MLSISISRHRQNVLVAVGLAILALVAGYWYMVLGVCGNYHDDAIYVSTAKAIAQGQGYRLINLPTNPVQTKYPFLYPLILAIIWKVWPSFPENLFAMQWLTLMTGATTIAFGYLYLVRFGYCVRGVAFAAGLLCATSPGFLFFCTQTLSEVPFALLVVLSLWALDKYVRTSSESQLSQFLLGILITLPFLCRTIGVVLPVVGLAFILCLGRPVFRVALGSAVGMSAWVIWVLFHAGSGDGDMMTLYYTDYLGWWSVFGLGSISGVFSWNVMRLMTTPLGIEGLRTVLLHLDIKIWIVFGIVLYIATFFATLRQLGRGRLAPWFMIAYLFGICLWPWPPYRFLVPVLPILLAYLLRAVWAMLRPVSPLPGCRYIVVAGVTLMVIGNLLLVYEHGSIRRQAGYPYSRFPSPEVSWASYEDVFEWLSENSEPDDVIASAFDSMIYLYTDRHAFRPYVTDPMAVFYLADRPPVGTVADLAEKLKLFRPRYIVQVPVPDSKMAERAFAEILSQFLIDRPGLLEPVYIGDDQRFVVYQFQSQVEIDA